MKFDRTEDFFRLFHSESEHTGSIVLERRCGSSPRQSQVCTHDLARITKSACGVEDIYFSTATYLGHPLLLNFSQTNCIHLQIPKSDLITESLVKIRLEARGIPLPTNIVFDGQFLTFLWFLESPIKNNEFYLYTLIEKLLFEIASGFNPTKSNLDPVFLTRVVGSINRKNKTYAHILSDYGKTYKKDYLVKKILGSGLISASVFPELQIRAGTTLELMSLLGSRWFSAAQFPELFHDWIIFFGASLCNFCTSEQLFRELRAIAESLENRAWKDIKKSYTPLIGALSQTAKDGYINIDGMHHSINGPTWRELILGKLQISANEISELNLQVLGNKSNVSPLLHEQNKSIYAVGHVNFIPIERLLMRAA
jgi:hypothetical protein